MSIEFNEKNSLFFLQTKNTSYVIELHSSNFLVHQYWGPKIKPASFQNERFKMYNSTLVSYDDLESISMDTSLFEYPTTGSGDFRSSAIDIQTQNGDVNLSLQYQSHKIVSQKDKIPGLPSTFANKDNNVETLVITIADKTATVEIDLYYSVFESYDVITRNTCIRNTGKKALKINRAFSANIEFPKNDFDLITLSGSYANEKQFSRLKLRQGIQSIESQRGISSHVHNPFMALVDSNTSEDYGQAYSMNLVYSGNFAGIIDVQNTNTIRMQMGINPYHFQWKLNPNESFYTPEVILVQANNGLGELSRIHHDFYRNCLISRDVSKHKTPIQINNWEGTYMDFDEEKILSMATTASEAGVELFVLDDGWFGTRDNDATSLGDWFVNKKKLPSGLDGLGNKINKLNLKFGLWFEPEMISKNSELFKAHPDWCLQAPNRPNTEQRKQRVLDFTRQDVRDHIYQSISKILREAPIEYVKWDMNRSFTEVYSSTLEADQQQEVFHRYVLGLYNFLDKLTKEFPNILFESCCSGGGRYDPGMLYYMPLTWTSDTTDAIERLTIQHGTSLIYPPSSISAHIAPSPNGLTGRLIPFETRVNCALFGSGFGFQLDITTLNNEELIKAKDAVQLYKKVEHIIRTGDLYRISNPPANIVSWNFVTKDKTEAFACWFKILSQPNPFIETFKFKGLNPEARYIDQNKNEYNGDYLINVGLRFKEDSFDFSSKHWHLKTM